MKPQRRWMILVLTLVTFGCAPLTSQALLELSEREGQLYRGLQPALVEAQDTFRITADALITSNANRKAAIMRREAAAERQAIYESLAVPNPPKDIVEEAIGKLVRSNVAVQTMADRQKEAAQKRIQAIVKTFEALDTTLGTVRENQQLIHGYLKARRQIFGRPGESALLPYKTFAETRDYLRQSLKDLEEQFKLAKEMVDAAKKEFGDQGKRP